MLAGPTHKQESQSWYLFVESLSVFNLLMLVSPYVIKLKHQDHWDNTQKNALEKSMLLRFHEHSLIYIGKLSNLWMAFPFCLR